MAQRRKYQLKHAGRTHTVDFDKAVTLLPDRIGLWYPTVHKVLAGRPLVGDDFTFQLKAGGKVLDTAKNDATGLVVFDPVEFSRADIGETFEYEIVEIASTETGMTSDPLKVEVEVKVGWKVTGIVLTVTYSEDIEFNNTYEAAGTWSPQVTVDLENSDLTANQFTFELRLGETLLDTSSNALDGTVTFADISYTEEDIGESYVYTVTQVAGDDPLITYDDSEIPIEVVVTDAGDGELDIVATVAGSFLNVDTSGEA